MSDRTARGSGGPAVCPFIALEDDRDFRLPVPDHRHRCFAETPSAPRALAHQAAYCLAPSFPGCPTFTDWARREAAPLKDERPGAEPRTPPGPDARVPPRPGAAPPGAGVPVPRPEPAPGPGGPSGWSDPPPWAPVVAIAAAPREAVPGGDARAAMVGGPARPNAADQEPVDGRSPAGDDLAAMRGVPPPGADRAAASGPASGPVEPGPPPAPAAADGGAAWSEPAALQGAGPEQAASTGGRPVPAAPIPPSRQPAAPADRYPPAQAPGQAWVGTSPAAPRPPTSPERRGPVGYAPVTDAGKAGPGRAGPPRDDAAPSWERPRIVENYGSLRPRSAGLPPFVRLLLIIGILGVALFTLPFVLRTITGGGGQPAASPSLAASASSRPSQSAAPTLRPVPTPTVYVVKAGDTLSKIAKKYGLTVEQVMAANPKLKNPDRIKLGDVIVIPDQKPSQIVDGSRPSASP